MWQQGASHKYTSGLRDGGCGNTKAAYSTPVACVTTYADISCRLVGLPGDDEAPVSRVSDRIAHGACSPWEDAQCYVRSCRGEVGEPAVMPTTAPWLDYVCTL